VRATLAVSFAAIVKYKRSPSLDFSLRFGFVPNERLVVSLADGIS
jgi:hypothetical protein